MCHTSDNPINKVEEGSQSVQHTQGTRVKESGKTRARCCEADSGLDESSKGS